MTYGGTKYLISKSCSRVKKWERKNKSQNLGNVQKYEQRQEIDRTFLSTVPNLHTNYV